MNFLAGFYIGNELKLKGPWSVIDTFRDPVTGEVSITGFISQVLPNVYVIAGVILFFLLVGGGLVFIISAGQENPEGAAKGKQAITAALMGFLIIFASYWIMQIIQVITGYDFGFRDVSRSWPHPEW